MIDEVLEEYVGGIYTDTYEIFIDHNQPIVRCRDCKHYTYNTWHRCDLHSIAHEVEPDGFCAWGERRERESAEVWNQWSADDVTCSEES